MVPEDVIVVLLDPQRTVRACAEAIARLDVSLVDLFAVGDMSMRPPGQPSYKQVYTAQEFAVRAVDAVDRRRRRARRREDTKNTGADG